MVTAASLAASCFPGNRNGVADGLVWRSPTLEPFVDLLPIPSRLAKPSTLVAHNATHRFHRDLPLVPTFAYGPETYFGPVVEATTGESLALTVVNSLGQHPLADAVDTTLSEVTDHDRAHPRLSHHLHGGVTAPGDDGHPMDTFMAPDHKTYHYQNRQDASGLWFHDHSMGITRLNVYAGLAGNYWLRDQWDTGESSNPLGLPSGEFEIPLVIADRGFNTDGTLRMRLVTFVAEGSWEGGMIGDVATVNGAVWPTLEVARGLYRFRVLNASNLTRFQLSLSNGARFSLLGSDLGFANAPTSTAIINLSAGERADVLVDFRGSAPGDEIIMRNTAPIPGQAEIWGAHIIPNVMKFRVTNALGPTGSIPTTLRGGPSRPATLAAPGAPIRTRRITISQNFDGTRNPPAFMALNNLDFASANIETPRQGTTELWEFINTSTDEHPMHLHLARMRVVDRREYFSLLYQLLFPRGSRNEKWNPDPTPFETATFPPQAHESSWKDTVWCPPNMVTRVLVEFPTSEHLGFDPDATYASMMGSPVQGYVFHCHILDHEDNEMMLPYRLVK